VETDPGGLDTVIYRGRDLDVLSLWSQYVTLPPRIKHPLPTFLDLVECPNPDHHTKKHHFQINAARPLVHCFANCGISGSYEHAISTIERCDGREATKAILRHTRVPLGGVKDQAAYEGCENDLTAPTSLPTTRRPSTAAPTPSCQQQLELTSTPVV
jgi:hypothetical protein